MYSNRNLAGAYTDALDTIATESPQRRVDPFVTSHRQNTTVHTTTVGIIYSNPRHPPDSISVPRSGSSPMPVLVDLDSWPMMGHDGHDGGWQKYIMIFPPLDAWASKTGGRDGGDAPVKNLGGTSPPDSRMKWPKSGAFSDFRVFWG